MALASTRRLFFERYHFEIQKEDGIYDEFERLARARNWKPGSKRRKYEKAWRECFGDYLPVRIKVEASEGETNGSDEDDEFVRVLRGMERLDLQEKCSNREEKLREVARQFTTYYGMDDRALGSWQILCVDCGIDGDFDSIRKCKKVNS